MIAFLRMEQTYFMASLKQLSKCEGAQKSLINSFMMMERHVIFHILLYSPPYFKCVFRAL